MDDLQAIIEVLYPTRPGGLQKELWGVIMNESPDSFFEAVSVARTSEL